MEVSQSRRSRWRSLLVVGLAALAAAIPVRADLQTGIVWLSGQQQPDGSVSTPGQIATSFQSTAEAVRALHRVGAGPGYDPGAQLDFLSAALVDDSEYLSRNVAARADAGADTAGLSAALDARRNADGGFGDRPGLPSTPLATAFALEALGLLGASDDSTVSYLLAHQRPDGGWGDGINGSSSYLTSQVLIALGPVAQQQGVGTALAAGHGFLVNAGGSSGWLETYLTAQALLALAPAISDLTLINGAVAALEAAQLPDGSWDGDAYTTSLALRALAAVAARGSGSGTEAAIHGRVVLDRSVQPLAGASVSLVAAQHSQQLFTGLDGRFSFAAVPEGAVSLFVSKSGYSSSNATVTAATGSNADTGDIALALDADTGGLTLEVADAATGEALFGVRFALTGAQELALPTNAAGRVEASGLAPGAYDFTLSVTGYQDLAGYFRLAAGTHLTLHEGMVRDGAYAGTEPVTLSGRVVDAVTGAALAGADVGFDGLGSLATDLDGRFVFPGVVPGSYQGRIGAAGYLDLSLAVTLAPGTGGDLGLFPLYPNGGAAAPTTLRLLGKVISTLDEQPLAGVAVRLEETGAAATSDAEGRFVLDGIELTQFHLGFEASDYQPTSYEVSASGSGEVYREFSLVPSGDQNAASSTLSGLVTDAVTGAPLAQADVAIPALGLSVLTGADGGYSLSEITATQVSLRAELAGYQPKEVSFDLPAFGNYRLNLAMDPEQPPTSTGIRIVSLAPQQPHVGSGETLLFDSEVANLTTDRQDILLVGRIYDANGVELATVAPYLGGTTTTDTRFSLLPNETRAFVVPWEVRQVPPGSYRLVLRAVEPETVTRNQPLGKVLSEQASWGSVTGELAFGGEFASSPPLLQAGSQTPARLQALVVNQGNLPLEAMDLLLTMTDADGNSVHTADATLSYLDVADHHLVDFGDWIPDTVGELAMEIRSTTAAGLITAQLYIGDKAGGTFRLAAENVPEGDSTVAATIAVNGVDVATATSTDPLFFAVREAVRKGAEFVGPAARLWNESNRCLGCHIQTQSLAGLASASTKTAVDPAAPLYLYDSLAGSLTADGGIRTSRPYRTASQTQLGLWALSYWPSSQQSFQTRYKAALHLYQQRRTDGDRVYWSPDEPTGWWWTNEAATAMVVFGYNRLLVDAQQLDLNGVLDYRLEPVNTFAVSSYHLDLELGPDGWLYTTGVGVLQRMNPATGAKELIDGALPFHGYGIAATEDGTLYVSGSAGRVRRISPDGEIQDYFLPASRLTDIELGPDGFLYLSDQINSTILRMTPDGEAEVILNGGPLRNPCGLAFREDGILVVANNGAGNLLEVDLRPTEPTIKELAGGLASAPLYLEVGDEDEVYFTVDRYYREGEYSPHTVLKASRAGVIERLTAGGYWDNRIFGITRYHGRLLTVGHGNNRLYEVESFPVDTSSLEQFRQTIPAIARWVVHWSGFDTALNTLKAHQLMILGEVRPWISDPDLLAQIDQRIAEVKTRLLAWRNADGGWGSWAGWGSDSMMTAWAGIALEYTNPSPDDPIVRDTIGFLLDHQKPDGAWHSENNVLGTDLAATSLVMIYMPQAMERLGGLDVDLHLTLPANIGLGNPSIEPLVVSSEADGSTHYQWSLTGVTATGQQIDFDLGFQGMQLEEVRPAALDAYLEFANSFVPEERLRGDLAIPQVRTAEGGSLAISTDKAAYSAGEWVHVQGSAGNLGPTVLDGRVEVAIYAADAAEALYWFPPIAIARMVPGEDVPFALHWSTETRLVGDYRIEARLFDQQGRQLASAESGFTIVASAPLPAISIAADRPVYAAWDQVKLTSRVTNTSSNSLQPETLAVIRVLDPNGGSVFTTQHAVPQLLPQALRDAEDRFALTDASAGNYRVLLELLDAFSHARWAEVETAFQVERHATQGLTGSVTVADQQLYQGVANQCNETIRNRASQALDDVQVHHLLVHLDSDTVLAQTDTDIALDVQGEYAQVMDVCTRSLEPGTYACLWRASVDGVDIDLGSAAFEVLEAPIEIQAELQSGERGRVLILLDEPAACPQIESLTLTADLQPPLDTSTLADAALYDDRDRLLDQETAALGESQIDGVFGAGANLAIAAFEPDSLALELGAEPASGILPPGLRIEARLLDGSGDRWLASTELTGGCIPPYHDQRSGDFRVDEIQLRSVAEDPLGPKHQPDLHRQRSYLEQLLSQAGWSYTIVTDGAAFERELQSGGFQSYLLLSEQARLSEPVQKQLREALWRGEGLVEAGGHDQRNGRLDEALGIVFRGKHSRMSGLELVDSPVHAQAQAQFALTDRTLSAELDGAQAIGYFLDSQGQPTTDPAASYHEYGAGAGIYVGFDLLAEASRLGRVDNVFAGLLLGALEAVQPEPMRYRPDMVQPLVIRVQNLGIATPGQALLRLPAGVEIIDPGSGRLENDGSWSWPFFLQEDQILEIETWLRLPEGSHELNLLVQSGQEPDWLDQATAQLILTTEPAPELDDALLQAAGLGRLYKNLLKYLQWAQDALQARDYERATDDLLRAADECLRLATPEAEAIRYAIAEQLRRAGSLQP